ncbi:hypothetical protein IAR55_001840 [Kwoniella newhampshirensis]|uniref:Uncharacterized protein n=1 Tax=Kwoniella newhampshirensis TaxID=1651941 RepID=A0AAW0Z3B8_9TREE
MSRLPPSQWFPDPNSWIETAPSSRPKRPTPTQRPLTSFSNGLATPISSTYKRDNNALAGPGPFTLSASAKNGTLKRWKGLQGDDTPIDKTRQGTLKGIFTPPTTGPNLRKGKGRVGMLIDKEEGGSKGERTPFNQKGKGGSMLAFGRKKDDESHKERSRAPLAPGGPGSRSRVYEDYFWRDSSNDDDNDKPDADVLPPSSQLKRTRRTANRPNTPLIIDATRDDNERNHTRNGVSPDVPPRTAQKRIASYRQRSSPLFPDKLGETPSPSQLPLPSSAIKTSPPIPEYVLGNHRQINHQDTARMNRIKSPWRKDRAPPPAFKVLADAPVSPVGDQVSKKRKRGQITHEEEIDRRVLDKAHEKRKRTPEGKPKALVDLSSSDPPEGAEDVKSPSTKRSKKHHGEPLSSIRPNALLPRRSLSKSTTGPTSSSLRRKPKTPEFKIMPPLPRTSVGDRSVSLDKEPAHPSTRSAIPLPSVSIEEQLEIAIDQAKENAAELDRAKEHAGDLESSLRAIGEAAASQKSQSQRPASLLLSPGIIRTSSVRGHHTTSPEQLLVTPRKRVSPNYHHKVTPPTSRPRPLSMVNRQETLFVLPDPPAQPDFRACRMPTSSPRLRDFQPMEMDPETLITWDAPRAETQAGEGFPVGDVNMRSPASSQSQEEPLFSQREGSPDNRPRLGHRWSSKSIEPTAFSQDFPVLLRSSSADESSPPSRPYPRNSDPDKHDEPVSGRPEVGGKRAAGASKWEHLNRGILSQHTPIAARPCTIPTSQKMKGKGNKRKPSSAGGSDVGNQTKLAAFGFFGDKGKGRGKQVGFEREWKDEEDHHFDEDGPVEGRKSVNVDGLGQVPEPPLHPDLQPAGIRELRRRSAAAKESSQLRQDTSSSLTAVHPPTPRAPTLQASTPKRQYPTKRKSKEEESEEGEMGENDAPLFERHSSSSWGGTGSSQTTSVGIRTPGSTRAWLDGLGERRTSEFGTME